MDKAKYFSGNLRLLRHINKVSQDELAQLLGYKSFTTVQKWEDGTSYPKLDNIAKICDYFNISLEHLLLDDLSAKIKHQQAIPIIGKVQAGSGIYAQEDYYGYEYVTSDNGGQEYFYLKVTGDSMINARIYEGDIVYVRKQTTVEHLDIAVVLLENNEATIKRILFDDTGMNLKPENDQYETRHFTYEQIEDKQIQILGKVIHNKIMF